jgi:hypothetical protein
MRTRRTLFSLLGGIALVPIVGAGCIEAVSSSPDVGPDGAIEVVPLTPGLYYGNRMPTRAPAVRQSPPVDPNWSVTKQ